MIKYIGNTRKRVAVLCDNFKILYKIQKIFKKRKITAYFEVKKETFYDAIIFVLNDLDAKKLLKREDLTLLYTVFNNEIHFLLDYASILKDFFVRNAKIGIDPGLHNIGLVVVAENIYIFGEIFSEVQDILDLIDAIIKYNPRLSNILIKIGNGVNYDIFLKKIKEKTKNITGQQIAIEIVDEKTAKQHIVWESFLKNRNILDAYKILISKGYRRI